MELELTRLILTLNQSFDLQPISSNLSFLYFFSKAEQIQNFDTVSGKDFISLAYTIRCQVTHTNPQNCQRWQLIKHIFENQIKIKQNLQSPAYTIILTFPSPAIAKKELMDRSQKPPTFSKHSHALNNLQLPSKQLPSHDDTFIHIDRLNSIQDDKSVRGTNQSYLDYYGNIFSGAKQRDGKKDKDNLKEPFRYLSSDISGSGIESEDLSLKEYQGYEEHSTFYLPESSFIPSTAALFNFKGH